MTPPVDFTRLRELFEAARDQPKEAREQYLAKACDDAELREEVARLLVEADESEGFLEPGLAAGARLSGFEIVRPIGRGGMGFVYEARQEQPNRRVALKTVWPGLSHSSITRRFRHEAELMAQLKHPAIAEVYASGVERIETPSGIAELPWYAMEFIEDALPLTEFAEVHALDREARLRLFAQVCTAVHHGHVRGVLHRDLKPDNVLVDGAGHPHVIDFGLARAMSAELGMSTLWTAPGAVLGTLNYMSPEQVAGDPTAVDVRSDVYALGVMLYELLAGTRPHALDGVSLPEAARIVCETEPRRPSTVRANLRGDLEAIVLMAIERDARRRYPSPAALADDLERFLNGQPTLARTPGLVDLARAFARRNRALVVAGVAIVVASLVAAVVSLVFAARAARSEADHRALFRRTLDRSIELTTETVGRIHQLPGGAQFARELLEDSLTELEALLEQVDGDTEVELRIATAEMRLGDVLGNPTYANLGDLDAAEERYLRAWGIAAGLPDHDLDVRRLRAFLVRRRAHVAQARLDLDTAQREGADSLRRFQSIHAARAGDPDAAKDLAFAHDLLAVLARTRGELDVMEEHVEAERELFARYRDLGGDPDLADFQGALAKLNLGAARYARALEAENAGQDARAAYLDAAEAYASAGDELEELVAARSDLLSRRERLAWARMWEGTGAYLAGELERGAEALADSHALYETLTQVDASNTTYPPIHANVLHMLGSVEVTRADRAESRAAEHASLERAAQWRREAVAVWEAFEAAGHLLPLHQNAFEHVRNALEEVESRLALE